MMMGRFARAVSHNEGPRFTACIADDVTREQVSKAAAELGWSTNAVRKGSVATAAKEIDPTAPPSVLVVDTADAADPAADIGKLIDVCGPETRLVAVGAVNDVGLFRKLMALGVADYLVKPVSAELWADTLSRAGTREEAKPDAAAKKMQLHAFIGARGGVGTTTLAVATAWLLAHEQKQRVALLDLDLHFGNLALSLDLEPGRGLRDALENPERTDSLLLSSAMVRESEHLPILAAEEPLEETLTFDSEATSSLMTALGNEHDCVIADVPRSLDALGRQALGTADSVVIVTDLSLAALRDTLRLTDLAKSLGNQKKPLLVANQVGASHRGEISRAEFERGLGSKVDIVVPFDIKAAMATARGGKALPAAAGSSKPAAELRRLAAQLSGAQPKGRGSKRRWFG